MVAAGARARLRRRRSARALTSRNALLPLRRALAERWPDVIKSNGGGANAILVRGAAIAERAARCCCAAGPSGASATRCGSATGRGARTSTRRCTRPSARQRGHRARRRRDAAPGRGGAPALLGGDFNVRAPAAPGFELLGGHGVDHVLGHGLAAAGAAEVPDRGALSDHAPVIVTVVRREPRGAGRVVRTPARPQEDRTCPACPHRSSPASRSPPAAHRRLRRRRRATAPSTPAAARRPRHRRAGRLRGVGRRRQGRDEGHQVRPADITAKVGQKIVWTNTDGQIPHTVTSRPTARTSTPAT